jgi:DNA-directed RNA polymerase subunit F
MKRKSLFLVGSWVVFLSIFASHACVAGVVIEQIVKNKEVSSSKVVLSFSESQVRTDHEQGGLTTIIDFKNDRMVMIDHRSKCYVEVKFSQWEKEVSERLKKDLPPIKAKKKKITVKKTGETATLNGFRTEKIEIWREGELMEENWMTRDIDMREAEKVMEKMAQGFSREFKSEMREGQEIYEKLKPYGFPILVKDYSITYGLGAIEVLEVKKIGQRDLKEDVFLPPTGYERIIPEPSKK